MMQLRNYMEEVVKDHVDKLTPAIGVCTCEICKMDIMAIMLNYLTPHYVVSDTGALYAQLRTFDIQHEADVVMAMTHAVETVRKRPRH